MTPLILQLKKLTPLCLITFALGCFALLPKAQATCDSPDPGCPGGNLAEGYLSLAGLVSGAAYNTGIGAYSLLSNTTGNFNTGVGAGALFSITTASGNTATGAGALFSHDSFTESGNTADGAFALFSDTTGHHNTAVGDRALFANTTGSQNVAVGDGALGGELFTTGNSNTVVGSNAGGSLTTGNGNVFVGPTTGNNFLSGDNNTCIGSSAGGGGNGGSTGSGNVFIGLLAGQNIGGGDSNICIGNQVLGETDAADSTYIGNINTTAQPIVAGVDGVTVDLTTGKLGHGVSSRRFKEEIKPMDTASEALYALKPVTFHYNKAIDPTQTLDFGLIAEEVAAVNPELAVRDREGKVSNYRHDAVNAMLLNEFLKEHKAFVSQQHTVEQQQATITRLEKQIEALAAGLQKVSAQLEASKPASQVVNNNR
jgi:hypothetical protein